MFDIIELMTEPIHPIERYLNETGQTQRQFADMVSLSLSYVNGIMRGDKNCGSGAALKIHLGTNGAISVLELLQANPPKKPKRGRPRKKTRRSRIRRKGTKGPQA